MALLSLTDAAAKQMKGLLEKAPEGALGMRIGTKTGGCSGLEYTMDYALEDIEGDEKVTDKDLTLFIKRDSILHLLGTEIDWEEKTFESGFVFRNPNEADRCGCGVSFNLKETAQLPAK